MFYFVNQADSTVFKDLENWNRVAIELVTQAIANSSPLQSRIQINANVVARVQEETIASPEDFRGIRDDRKNLQAAAIVTDMDDHLFIEYLVTAPWNMAQDSPLAVKKAATALMAELAKESQRNRHSGRILLYAIPDAVEFYHKIGLVETSEGSPNAPEMELTPQAAVQLINRQI